VIDTTTNTVTQTIPSGTEPFGIAIDPTTHTAYVTNYYSENVNNTDSGTVAVIQRHAG